jgi:ribosomal protein S18 acetylase RimI-like enzyme
MNPEPARDKQNDSGVINGLSFRPIGSDDEDFLYRVYASTRDYEMSIVPWDAAQKEAFLKQQFTAQRDYYFKEFPRASYQIILRDGVRIGRLYVDRREKEIHILDITLAPEYRNAGLGTPLLEGLMNEARAAGKTVSIYVDTFSPAVTLFERLGFSRIADNGISALFRWQSNRSD